MTRDLAADLAEVFWHMTWDLCINFAMFFNYTWGMHFPFLLTDDMGIFDQFWQESWDFQENTSAICNLFFLRIERCNNPNAISTVCELVDMTCFASFRAQTIAEVLCRVIFFEALYRLHRTCAFFCFLSLCRWHGSLRFLGMSDYSHVICRYYTSLWPYPRSGKKIGSQYMYSTCGLAACHPSWLPHHTPSASWVAAQGVFFGCQEKHPKDQDLGNWEISRSQKKTGFIRFFPKKNQDYDSYCYLHVFQNISSSHSSNSSNSQDFQGGISFLEPQGMASWLSVGTCHPSVRARATERQQTAPSLGSWCRDGHLCGVLRHPSPE